ncbi:unnamed protein product [Triticum turgidum subsp. durum]|uniref:K+ potassium transporter C-terminal domain-containing protein n=1 Tax=Triticum turgidum subsp. durum TaxID=4567 RepID=A0A9R1PNN4_TRITD|nr:unnamed protein product [Triticum turgidum subsp. durum]
MARSTRRSSMTMTMQQHYSSASYTESLALARARSTSSGATGRMNMNGMIAEEMMTPAESFSELAMQVVPSGRYAASSQQLFQAAKMSLEEMAKIEEEQRYIEREMEKGVVYIMGENEVVARPHSSLLKKVIVNYVYAFLRKNCRQGDKMLAIPRSQLLKVGMSYEI